MYKLEVSYKTVRRVAKYTLSDQKKVYKVFRDLEQNPLPAGKDLKKLSGSALPLWRIRIGNLRIIYEISSEQKVVKIIKVDFRGNIY